MEPKDAAARRPVCRYPKRVFGEPVVVSIWRAGDLLAKIGTGFRADGEVREAVCGASVEGNLDVLEEFATEQGGDVPLTIGREACPGVGVVPIRALVEGVEPEAYMSSMVDAWLLRGYPKDAPEDLASLLGKPVGPGASPGGGTR